MTKKNINAIKARLFREGSLSRRQLRALGFLPLTFFVAQAIHYWQINELEHMLWMCNIGNLLLALGLFFEHSIMIRVALLWMFPGLVVWFFYVVPTWGMLLTGNFTLKELFGVISSSLAHLGGFTVALIALRQVRMNGRAWLYGFAWYFAIQVLSRFLTPAAMNVNLSHNVQAGWEQTFNSYWKFWLVLTAVVGAGLWLFTHLLEALWPASAADR